MHMMTECSAWAHLRDEQYQVASHNQPAFTRTLGNLAEPPCMTKRRQYLMTLSARPPKSDDIPVTPVAYYSDGGCDDMTNPDIIRTLPLLVWDGCALGVLGKRERSSPPCLDWISPATWLRSLRCYASPSSFSHSRPNSRRGRPGLTHSLLLFALLYPSGLELAWQRLLAPVVVARHALIYPSGLEALRGRPQTELVWMWLLAVPPLAMPPPWYPSGLEAVRRRCALATIPACSFPEFELHAPAHC